MTTIKYIGHGTSAQIDVGGKPYICNPTAEIPDKFIGGLVLNKQFMANFVVVGAVVPPPPTESLVCDVCNQPCKSKAGLSAHKRKHKDKT